ncbi:hypothetical protein Tco_1316889 [Tanacetum coccineum]
MGTTAKGIFEERNRRSNNLGLDDSSVYSELHKRRRTDIWGQCEDALGRIGTNKGKTVIHNCYDRLEHFSSERTRGYISQLLCSFAKLIPWTCGTS